MKPMIRELVKAPNNLLRKNSGWVTEFSPKIRLIGEDMKLTMYANNGVGLSAVQIGHPIRMVVMDTSAKADDPRLFINPEIVWRKGTQIYQEGCLSIPGASRYIERSAEIGLFYVDGYGKARTERLVGLAAQCAQHEYDHLMGLLMTDIKEARHGK